MYFIENVASRRVYIYPPATRKFQHGTAEKPQYGQTNSHRVVIVLEKFTQDIGGLRVRREATEEVDEILVAHA
jgi:hypothetical protein